MSKRGNLIVVSGPSGAGKSALVSAVLQRTNDIRFSISYTTRAPRAGEKEGNEYNFVGRDEFEELLASDSFLEWAFVHGNYYGTARKAIEESLVQGVDILLDIDVQGAASIRTKLQEAITIFIMPPSFDVLRARLENRKSDDSYTIEMRLKRAREEIKRFAEYDYIIINDLLEEAVEELTAIIRGSRCRKRAQLQKANHILETFGGMNAEDP